MLNLPHSEVNCKGVARLAVSPTDTDVPTAKVAFMGGGKTACPWKNMTSIKAKEAAANFMLRMADGSVAGAVPNP